MPVKYFCDVCGEEIPPEQNISDNPIHSYTGLDKKSKVINVNITCGIEKERNGIVCPSCVKKSVDEIISNLLAGKADLNTRSFTLGSFSLNSKG